MVCSRSCRLILFCVDQGSQTCFPHFIKPITERRDIHSNLTSYNFQGTLRFLQLLPVWEARSVFPSWSPGLMQVL